MGIERRDVFVCDRCGFEEGEPYDHELSEGALVHREIPLGWQRVGEDLLCPKHEVWVRDLEPAEVVDEGALAEGDEVLGPEEGED